MFTFDRLLFYSISPSERFHSYDGIPQVRNRNSDREKFSSWVSPVQYSLDYPDHLRPEQFIHSIHTDTSNDSFNTFPALN